jgi:hypothetical protein
MLSGRFSEAIPDSSERSLVPECWDGARPLLDLAGKVHFRRP